jgi:hypothetical protein
VNPNGRGLHLNGKVKTRKQTMAAHHSLAGNASVSSLAFSLPIFGTINPAAETKKSFRSESNNSASAAFAVAYKPRGLVACALHKDFPSTESNQ